MNNFKVSSESEQERFKAFVDDELNERIIFSGIFGIGKTTFLNDFFTNEKFKDDYLAIHLFPTNYSVASNEDIFELIKADILLQIIERIQLEKTEVSKTTAIAMLDAKHHYYLLKPFLTAIPKLSAVVKVEAAPLLNALSESIESLENIVVGIKEYYKEIENKQKELSVNEGETIKKYFTELEEKIGSIYERNFITELIRELLVRARGENKKIVLVVDDLDRIDPEHIFRIINIFAVHIDAYINKELEIKNKFGFDKIILSCDISNVRKIFKHKFGIAVDFNGYIDKFYSTVVYKFDNKDNIEKIINGLVDSIQCSKSVTWQAQMHNENDLLRYLLKSLLFSGALNLRSIRKMHGAHFEVPTYKVRLDGRYTFENTKLPLLQVFDFLTFLFGSPENLVDAIDRLRMNDYLVSHKSVMYAFANTLIFTSNGIPDLTEYSERRTWSTQYKLNGPIACTVHTVSHNSLPFYCLSTATTPSSEDFLMLLRKFTERYLLICNDVS